MPYAAAYLRKSRSDDPTREVSRDVQERAVRDLAERAGVEDLRLFVDWDRSGDDAKVSRRASYQEMLGELRAGELHTIFAYSADRLYRGLTSFLDLQSTAAKAKVGIVTARDGVIGGDGSPMAIAFAQIGAVFGELELNTAKARAKAAAASRRRRGDHLGAVPYGYRLDRREDGVVRLVPRPDQPIAPVLDAWERSGRRARTCARILNDEMSLPAARGGNWDRLSILRLVSREAPDRLPRKGPSGRREEPPKPVRLAKLLRCHCGRTMTPNLHRERRPGRGQGTQLSYYCAAGVSARNEHPRGYVAESKLMPWIMEEAARLHVPVEQVTVAVTDQADRDALDAKRQRIIESYVEDLVSKVERDRLLGELDAAYDRLDARLQMVSVPPAIDWTAWPERTVNDVLRAMWRYVQLDVDLRPKHAVWNVPEWRS